MTSRIAAVSALSLVLLIGGSAAMWVGVDGWFGVGSQQFVEDGEWEAHAARLLWAQTLAAAAGPLVGAGLIAGVGALALVVWTRGVRRTQEG